MLTTLLWPLLLVVAYNPNPWENVRDDDTVHIWARPVPGSPVREVRAQRVINASAERVWDVIADVDHYTDFMPYVVEARAVSAGKDNHFEYLRVNPPLVSPRDYTLKITEIRDHERGEFVRSWSATQDHGPPPRSDSVRLHVCDGSWTLRRLPGNRTEVTYWVYTDPAGSIPSWIANRANHTSLPDMLAAVEKRSIDPSWTR